MIVSLENIAELVRQERKKRGMTQVQAAGLCGVGVRFFSELENAKPTLQIDKVLRVMRMFGIKISLESSNKEKSCQNN